MALLWITAADRGGLNCLVCGEPLDFDADDNTTWWDDNANTPPDERAANMHKTLDDCKRAKATARNMRGERSIPDPDDS